MSGGDVEFAAGFFFAAHEPSGRSPPVADTLRRRFRIGRVMYEHRSHPLLPRRKFILRVLRAVGIAALVVFGGLGIGMVGYHFTEGLPWIDSLLNSSMILFGMGPVNPIQTCAGKLFASLYAMFSGLVFLSVSALIFAPLFHRMVHCFHLQLTEDDEEEERRTQPEKREQIL